MKALGSVQDAVNSNVATVCVSVNVEELDAQYKYVARLWDQEAKATGKQPCDELEGLCNLLEAMLDIIAEEGVESHDEG